MFKKHEKKNRPRGLFMHLMLALTFLIACSSSTTPSGDDARTLYVTARAGLYRVELANPGLY